MSQPGSPPTEKDHLQGRYSELDRELARTPLCAQPSPYGHSNTVPVLEEEVTGPEPPAAAAAAAAAPAAPAAPAAAVQPEQHYDEAGTSTPPPYSGPSSSAPADAAAAAGPAAPRPKGPRKYPGLPALDYSLYAPPLFTLSADATAIKSAAPHLSADAGALASLIRAQSTVPPKPQVHITGSRGRRVDFAVKLNLLPLLVPEDPRRRMDYIRCVAAGEPALRGGARPSAEPEVGEGGLEAWCRRFVEDKGPVKSFALERVVVNLDTAYLEFQARSLVTATGYKGTVGVTFPATHARVVVQHPGRANRFFTGITTLFASKRQYEVVKAVWPFATRLSGEPGRQFAVQSEEAWWREWQDAIRYAVATKRHGWVTTEDKFEVMMEGKGKAVVVVDWGPEE